MKKINFKAVPCEMVDGSVVEIDLSKELANIIYTNAKEVGEAVFAQDLYKEGEVELTEENIETIKKHYNNFFYFIRAGIDKALA